jgi:hypothetical protein
VKILPIIERSNWQSQVSCRYIRFYIVSKCTFVTDNGCRCRSANLPFYQAKLLLCRFVTTTFSPLVEFAGISNTAVRRDDCICFFQLVYSFHIFSRISNFFVLSTTEETWIVEMRIWCIKICILLILHL